MASKTDDTDDKSKSSWRPTLKDGAIVLTLLGSTVGSYKLIDAAVEQQVKQNTSQTTANAGQVADLSRRIGDLAKKIEALDATIGSVQADRLRDLRTVYERGTSLQGAIDTLSRQLADVKSTIDGNERRTGDADRDIKQQISELRQEVNAALRAPLVGPRSR